MDQFRDYAARGDAFAEAVRRLRPTLKGRRMSTTARERGSHSSGRRGDPPHPRPSARVLPARARHVRAAARPRPDHGPERQFGARVQRSYDHNFFAIIERQALFAVVGLVGAGDRRPAAAVGAAQADPAVPHRRRSLLILATFIPGVGLEVNGNRNWLPLPGPLQLQPSEFAKLAVVLWIADLYARRQRKLGTPGRSSCRWCRSPAVSRRSSSASTTSAPLWCCSPSSSACSGSSGCPPGRWAPWSPASAVVCVFFVAIEQRTRHPDAQLPQPDGRSRQGRISGDPQHDGVRPRRLLGRRPRRQPAEVGGPAGGAHRLHPRRDR